MHRLFIIFICVLTLISCESNFSPQQNESVDIESQIEQLNPEDLSPEMLMECRNLTRFAVIGDIAGMTKNTEKVSEMVRNWRPNFIITLGDNFYNNLGHDPDTSVGQYYSKYMYPYTGAYPQSPVNYNRFYSSVGGHDWNYDFGQTYFDYFTLPGNERYYDIETKNTHLFCYNSCWPESVDSTQRAWLEDGLKNSTKNINIVYFHASPYSSGRHGGKPLMRLPFREWGADIVLSGHDHHYERIVVDSLTYIVNGCGGQNLREINDPVPGSLVRYNEKNGAMLVFVFRRILVGFFINTDRQVIDVFKIKTIN